MQALAAAVLLTAISGTALAYADTSIKAPSNITMEAEWFFSRVDTGSPTVNVASGLTYETSNNEPALFRLGSTVVTWLVQDSSGGRAIDTQTITIRDTTPPSCPEGQTVLKSSESKRGKAIPVEFEIQVITDLADLNVNVTSSHESGSKFAVGDTTVILTGTDDSGHTVDCPMIIRVIIPTIKDLNLEPTHDAIKATWTEFENLTSYRVLLADADGDVLQKTDIRGDSHTFADLKSDTEYTVTVKVREYIKVKAVADTTTLPLPRVITDDFSSTNGWTHVPTIYTSGFNNYTFAIDSADGNPAPSARISGDGELANSRIEKWIDMGDRGSGPLFFGIDYKAVSDTTLYGQIVVGTADSQTKYVKSIWAPAQASGWSTHLKDISGVLGDGDRIRVQLYLHDLDGADNGYSLHFDNLYMSEVRPGPVFRGGADDTTREQDAFDRVLSQILSGEADPHEYMSGAKSLGQYDELLKRVLVSLGIVPP